MRIPLLLTVLAIGAGLSAQPQPAVGLGEPIPQTGSSWQQHKLDVQSLTGNNGCLGVARDILGHIYVSARNLTANQPHWLYEFDTTGKLVNSHQAPLTRSTSTSSGSNAWGLRDLAFDGVRTLYGSAEAAATNNTIYAFDTITKQWVSSRDVKHAPGPSTVRALAYDPTGDGGKGSFWTGSFGSAIFEISKTTGNILRTQGSSNLVPGAASSIYGAGYDPVRKTIWWWHQRGGMRTSGPAWRVYGTEMDTATMSWTGSAFYGDGSIAHSSAPGGIAGGFDIYIENGERRFLALTQATSDTVYVMHGQYNTGTTCGGTIGMRTGAFSGNSNFAVTVENSPVQNGAAFLLISPGRFAIPAPPGLFANGCTLQVDITKPLIVLQGTITNGSANISLPIPQGVFGSLMLQVAESKVPATLPLTLTDGGALHVIL